MIVTLQQFEKDIRAIFSEGNMQYAYDLLPKHVGIENDQTGENVLTYETLIKQFKRHHEAWNKEFGDTEPKYITREDKDRRKNIGAFLAGKWYQHYFDFKTHPRDQYLFGNVDEDFLTEQRKQFENDNKTRKL